ncbi:tetratricopeptide (TPR) repeat protein [Chryseobacterium bernardetii]|uniref:Tetratricopeptide (TPR) repeat protein n=1 Tax=Chryseobacterium bernardetii TaxID=1241978 RepID=A0ACC6IX59_9FLAO|nr:MULTISPECIES: DUF4365 domain-containing protein [Chryseobacterium]MDR6372336.1 tetratricopeptide (TPR) repeat protein [Chryseobacterium vietnamense]MDR6442280.1 tetratricopeptide (TPR) repeat protein [Chryseobacterium bernardetii]
MKKFPQRHKNHVLESMSEKFFKDHLPEEWIAEKPIDYGIDYKVEIIIDDEVVGQNFSVQLKSHVRLKDDGLISISLARSTVNYYLARLEPILVVCYIREHHEAYYQWFSENSVDLTKDQQTHSIKFDPEKKISSLDWNDVAAHVNTIFSRRHLLHSFASINFSQLGIEEKNASSYYIAGNFEAANIIFKELNRKKPNPYWLTSIAMCHYGLYQYREALYHINLAINMESSVEILLNKASILSEYGKESNNRAMVIEARDIFSKAIEDKQDYNLYYNYATTLSWLQENELSEIHFKKSLKLNPNNAKAWKNLAEIHHRQQQFSEEMECYDKALMIEPSMPEALMSKGIALIRDHTDYNNGLIYLQRTELAEPDLFLKFQDAYFWFAFVHMKLGEQDKGLGYIENGLTHYPGNPYLLNLKRDFLKDNWSESEHLSLEAVDFLTYRLGLEPSDMIALETLCRIHLQQNNTSDVYNLLRKYTILFHFSDINSFNDNYFDFEPFVNSLFSHYNYYSFRKENPMQDINRLNSPTFFFEYCELVGLKLFHEAQEFFFENSKNINFEDLLLKHLFTQAVNLYPAASTYYITSKNEDIKAFGEQLTEVVFILMPMIASKEIARIIGHLQLKEQMDNTKIQSAISKFDERTYNQEISMACLEAIQARFHFFPEK